MSDFVDPYINQSLGILRNLVGATTQEELNEVEREISYANELNIGEVKHTCDFGEICNIHKVLFGDIYDWAGEIRTVDIRKPNQEYFLICGQIIPAVKYVFGELEKDNYLKGLSMKEFINKLAYYYEQLNFIHPFREGNGRTQRIFWTRIAKDAGFMIDWNGVVGEELNLASIAGHEKQDLRPLEEMFGRIVRLLPKV